MFGGEPGVSQVPVAGRSGVKYGSEISVLERVAPTPAASQGEAHIAEAQLRCAGQSREPFTPSEDLHELGGWSHPEGKDERVNPASEELAMAEAGLCSFTTRRASTKDFF